MTTWKIIIVKWTQKDEYIAEMSSLMASWDRKWNKQNAGPANSWCGRTEKKETDNSSSQYDR